MVVNLLHHPVVMYHSDRGGIGMEGVKKRKAEEELEHYRQKARAKQQNEKQSLEDFR